MIWIKDKYLIFNLMGGLETISTLRLVKFEGVKSAEPPIIAEIFLAKPFRTSSDLFRVAADFSSYFKIVKNSSKKKKKKIETRLSINLT